MATTVRGSVWIDRPPTTVLRVLFDQAKMTQWTTDLDSVEIVRGAPGEVGSLARLRYVQGGKSYEMMDELLEYEAGKRIVSRVTGDAISAEVETILLPADGGNPAESSLEGHRPSAALETDASLHARQCRPANANGLGQAQGLGGVRRTWTRGGVIPDGSFVDLRARAGDAMRLGH